MLAHAGVIPFRILIITPDQASSINQAICARCPHATVITVTTPTALDTAVRDGHYDAVCLQYPPPWTNSPSATEVLREWLPACPILLVAPQNQAWMLKRLVAMVADGQRELTAEGVTTG